MRESKRFNLFPYYSFMYSSSLIDTLSAPAKKPDTTSTFCSREQESEGECECECEERVKAKY